MPDLTSDSIRIRGARVHNLKNISLAIPHEQLTVVTGVSGSGKSSLAFDTIYAEGQRRYVESLSAYARQFLERMEKPDVDEIDGIAPPVAIRQKNTTRNPRSTVATPPSFTIFCACCGPAPAAPFAPTAESHVQRDTVDQVAGDAARAAGGIALVRAVPGRARRTPPTLCATACSICARKASTACSRTAECSNFPRPNPCSTSISRNPSLYWWTASRSCAILRRHPPAHRRCRRNLLSRSGRSRLRARRRRRIPPLQRKVPMQKMRHGISRAGAEPVQF